MKKMGGCSSSISNYDSILHSNDKGVEKPQTIDFNHCYLGDICNCCYIKGIHYVDYDNKISKLTLCHCCNQMLCNHHYNLHNSVRQCHECPY